MVNCLVQRFPKGYVCNRVSRGTVDEYSYTEKKKYHFEDKACYILIDSYNKDTYSYTTYVLLRYIRKWLSTLKLLMSDFSNNLTHPNAK